MSFIPLRIRARWKAMNVSFCGYFEQPSIRHSKRCQSSLSPDDQRTFTDRIIEFVDLRLRKVG